MALRITTWNVNGIRNPFAFHPWCEQRSFQAMFDILEADIVCIQELKIQRKDLKDDMVLVPGWDCFCTFPKYKKGYSGVAIYTRQSKCNPIKAEEGLTGILEAPNSLGKSYLTLPPSETIGGYPDLLPEEAMLLDSEGRCIILDFGAFVLIGLYCPAQINPARDGFRIAFAAALNQRIRNLVEIEKRSVVVVGDLNIARDEIDNSMAKEIMMEGNLEDYKNTPNRQMLHKLLKPHEDSVMVDLCREFFPDRPGMYTCWDVSKNARPGNYGSRIDYILCTLDMKGWFGEANIQEGLMGSDHCPVYGVINKKVSVEGDEKHILDIVNPPGLFVDGERQESQVIPQLKLSVKMSGEYFGRQSIRDMFLKVSAQSPSSNGTKNPSSSRHGFQNRVLDLHPFTEARVAALPARDSLKSASSVPIIMDGSVSKTNNLSATPQTAFRSQGPSIKRQKTAGSSGVKASSIQRKAPPRGQQSLRTFLKQPSPDMFHPPSVENLSSQHIQFSDSNGPDPLDTKCTPPISSYKSLQVNNEVSSQNSNEVVQKVNKEGSFPTLDPIVSKEKWSQFFTKPQVPRCEGHGEPCIQRITRKPGANVGRAFWICSRPLGPDGAKITSRQIGEWRCNYFKWSSD